MKYFVGPITTRKRDKRVNSLIRKGHATHDELHEAQFGQWPISGMNKDIKMDGVVSFKGFGEDPECSALSHLFRLGYARSDEESGDTIYLNRLTMSPLTPVLGVLATRLAYARAHDVLGLMLPLSTAPFVEPILFMTALMSSYRFAIASSFTKVLALSTADVVGEEHIHTFHAKDPTSAIAVGAFQSVAQDWFENQDEWRKTGISINQAIDMVFTLMPRAYYASDAELQARLHNVMVRGYPAWGKIPENIDDLYAALMDMGIKSSTEVRQYYNKPENSFLKLDFNKHASWEEAYLSPPNAEMNIGLNSYRDGKLLGLKTGEILRMYWEDCLPFLFADLVQNKYGDSGAMKRFGYSEELDMVGLPVRLEPKFK